MSLINRNTFVFSCLITLVISCTQKQNSPLAAHTLSIQLSDKALKMWQTHLNTDTASRLQSLLLLDSAIKVNNRNFIAYDNKVTVLLSMKRIDEANKVLSEVNSLTNNADFYMTQGFIYERAYHDSVVAQQKFHKSLSILDSVCKVEPGNKNAFINRAYFTMLIKGKEEGIKSYGWLIQKYGNDKTILEMKEQFYEFDRSIFINSLW